MLVWFIACTTAETDTADTLSPSADEVGEHTAATSEISVSGPGGLALPTQLWYPSQTGDTSPHAYDDWFEGTAVDGDPDCSEPRPVVVFSHGNTGVRYQSIFLTEHLATHGYVVAAPDHVGNTIFDDGDVPMGELLVRRPADIAAVFDALLVEPSLEGCVDPDAGYAVMGHSFGGYTSLAVAGAVIDWDAAGAYCASLKDDPWLCEEVQAWVAQGGGTVDGADPRVWAAVPQTPAGYEVLLGGLELIDVPMMMMGGQNDTLTTMEEEVRPLYEGLTTTPRHLGELEGADHFDFSDACNILDTYPGCGESPIELDEAHRLVRAATTAFLGELRGLDYADAVPWTDTLWTWETAD